MRIALEFQSSLSSSIDWEMLTADSVTNEDGRAPSLWPTLERKLEPGMYRLTFHTEDYFKKQGESLCEGLMKFCEATIAYCIFFFFFLYVQRPPLRLLPSILLLCSLPLSSCYPPPSPLSPQSQSHPPLSAKSKQVFRHFILSFRSFFRSLALLRRHHHRYHQQQHHQPLMHIITCLC